MDNFEEGEEELLPGLSRDVAIQCIAKAPRSAFGALRCVNRAWRSLLSSPGFFAFRKEQGLSEEWLYVMLRSTAGHYDWKVFRVAQRSWQVLPPMPVVALGAACAVLDSRLYLLGGSDRGVPTRKVWIYDPCFNRWMPGPALRAPREFAAAGVIRGKLYVVGGCSATSWAGSIAWAEVYDPAVGKWNAFPSPPERRERWMQGSAVLDDKLFAVADSGSLVMNPGANTWNTVSRNMDAEWRGKPAVVKEMLFSWHYKTKIMAYDLGSDSWRPLELVDKTLPTLEVGLVMASVAGKLFLLGEHLPKVGVSFLNLSAVDIQEGSDKKLRGRILWSHDTQYDLRVFIIHCLAIGL